MKYTRLTSFLFLVPLFILFSCKSRKDNSAKNANPVQETVRISNPLPSVSIHEAALDGLGTMVKSLLESKTNVNALDQEGRTALMYAAFNGHYGVMVMLIDAGASVNFRDSYGRTALMMASSGPYPDAVKLLLDNYADPNLTDKEEHFSALMYASAEGQMEVVKILLSAGADPSLKDIDGDNAGTFALNNGHKEIADLLQSKGPTK